VPRDGFSYQSLTGALLALAGSAILMGIITAEALYPAPYSTFDNEISDLGATRPPDSVILQPSAAIFDITMIVTGVLIIAAAILLWHARVRRLLVVAVMMNGVGVLGVGIFPGNMGNVHPWFAALAFLGGGLCGLAGWRATDGVLRWASGALGAVALTSLFYVFFAGVDAPITRSLGDGGAERWIAYPVVLWLVMFGGALMGGSAHLARRQPGSPPAA
jgi:hypothetical membrane protein